VSHTHGSATYGDDLRAFIRDVEAADWAALRWRTGPVVDYDISWGVYVDAEAGEIPAFLTTRNLAAGSQDRLVLLVQIQRDGSYLIAGQGLDQAH